MKKKEQCKICGESNPCVLENHHKIPRRHSGPDTKENLVTLCANCHRTIENIFNHSFWKTVGLYKENDADGMAKIETVREIEDEIQNLIHDKTTYLSEEAGIDEPESTDYSEVSKTYAYELGMFQGMKRAKHRINTYEW